MMMRFLGNILNPGQQSMTPAVFDRQVRQVIEDQISGIAGLTDLERARALREFTYSFVPLAWSGKILDDTYGEIGYESAAVLLPLLAKREHGCRCCGSSYVLSRLCQLFDMEAYVYNCGQSGTTHCVSLIGVKTGQGQDVLLEDAFFNAELQEKGVPLPFEAALDRLGSGRQGELTWHTGVNRRKPAVVSVAREQEARAIWMTFYKGRRVERRGDTVEYEVESTYMTFERTPAYQAVVQERFGFSAFEGIFLMPLGTSGEAEAEALAGKAREIGDRMAMSNNHQSPMRTVG